MRFFKTVLTLSLLVFSGAAIGAPGDNPSPERPAAGLTPLQNPTFNAPLIYDDGEKKVVVRLSKDGVIEAQKNLSCVFLDQTDTAVRYECDGFSHTVVTFFATGRTVSGRCGVTAVRTAYRCDGTDGLSPTSNECRQFVVDYETEADACGKSETPVLTNALEPAETAPEGFKNPLFNQSLIQGDCDTRCQHFSVTPRAMREHHVFENNRCRLLRDTEEEIYLLCETVRPNLTWLPFRQYHLFQDAHEVDEENYSTVKWFYSDHPITAKKLHIDPQIFSGGEFQSRAE